MAGGPLVQTFAHRTAKDLGKLGSDALQPVGFRLDHPL
jgi:hypothetical protein